MLKILFSELNVTYTKLFPFVRQTAPETFGTVQITFHVTRTMRMKHKYNPQYSVWLFSVLYGSGERSRYSDSLTTGLSGDRIPVWGQIFRNRPDRPGAHPASCTIGTGSFAGIKRPGRGVDHPPPSSAEVTERVELYLYSPSGPSWPVLG
jgi:hypothetical protein